jgi:hypothetical protein
MTAVRDQIDSGGAAGRIEIGTAGMASILAVITLGYSGASTGTVTDGVLTLAGFPRSDTSADNTGVAAAARIRTSAGTDVVTGLTVGTAGADINLDSTSITAGQTVTLTSAVITHA